MGIGPTSSQKETRLESVKFKCLLDTTRKFALSRLDHLDRVGVTRVWKHPLRVPAAPGRLILRQ